MTGLQAAPGGTLIDRALRYLGEGPSDSVTLAHRVLGLPAASKAVADRVAVALLGNHPRVRQLADGQWGLTGQVVGSPDISACTFAVVDVETTGGRPSTSDRITEIAIVTVVAGEIESAFETLVNPGRPIPRVVSALTHITDEMVRDQPTFSEIADDVVGVLAGRVFVAHNVRFDWGFVTGEIQRASDLQLDGPRLCTVRLARRLIPGLRSRGLDSLAAYFGVDIANRHRAGADAMATARILGRLLELARERGARTLDDLAALTRRRQRRRRRKSALPKSVEEI